MELIYQIHNIGIFLDGPEGEWRERTLKLLKDQFDGFEVYLNKKIVEYKLIIRDLERLVIPNDTIVVPENSYFLPDGTICWFERHIAYRIDKNEIYFWVKDETWFAPYLIEYLLEMQKETFVHGAGISVGEGNAKRGILLLAFGGIGKTCFISKALRKENIKLLGDDLIILDREGCLRSYPRPFCIYKYHKNLFKEYFSNHKLDIYYVKNNQYLLRGIRKIKRKLGMRVRPSSEYMLVSPMKIFTDDKLEMEKVLLKDAYILRRKTGLDKIEVTKSNDIEKATMFAQNVLMHEWDIGMKILYNRKAESFENIVSYMKENYDTIYDCLKKAHNIYLVDIPESMDAESVSVGLTEIIVEEKR